MNSELFVEASKALNALPLGSQKLLRDDWFDVVLKVESIRTKDGIIDGAIPLALRQCGIESRSAKELEAYRRLLMELYLFGAEAKRKSAERRSIERGGASA